MEFRFNMEAKGIHLIMAGEEYRIVLQADLDEAEGKSDIQEAFLEEVATRWNEHWRIKDLEAQVRKSDKVVRMLRRKPNRICQPCGRETRLWVCAKCGEETQVNMEVEA